MINFRDRIKFPRSLKMVLNGVLIDLHTLIRKRKIGYSWRVFNNESEIDFKQGKYLTDSRRISLVNLCGDVCRLSIRFDRSLYCR